MSKKYLPNTKKEIEIIPEINKNFKQLRILMVIGLLLIGLIIGWGMNSILSGHTSKRLKTDQVNARNDSNNKTTSKFNFINPYVLTPEFGRINNRELTSFKDEVEHYCINAKKDKAIKQISVYFRDLSNGSWTGINEKEKFIPASLSKVPILMAIFQKADSNPEYLQKQLTYLGSPAASYLDAHPEIDDIRTSLKVSESYTIDHLVDVMIAKSDNEATVLLLKDLGSDYLSNLQKRLGYDIPLNASSATNIISVKNYSSFFRILYNASLLSREYSEKALEILSRTDYNEGIRLAIPSNIRICQKYGERDTLIDGTKLQIQQLHHAGIVYYPGKPFFLIIMTKGNDKQKMKKVIYDIAKLVYNEVDKQAGTFKKPKLSDDIEK